MGHTASRSKPPKLYEVRIADHIANRRAASLDLTRSEQPKITRQHRSVEYGKSSNKSFGNLEHASSASTTTATTTKNIDIWVERFAQTMQVPYCAVTRRHSGGDETILAEFGKSEYTESGEMRKRAMYFLTKSDDVAIVDDASKESRFWQHAAVLKNPQVKFYASAPLLGQDDTVLGRIVYASSGAKHITEDQRKMIIWSADIVARELQVPSDEIPVRPGMSTMNSKDRTAHVLCDMRDAGASWKLLYANNAWQVTTKVYPGAKLNDTFANISNESIDTTSDSFSWTVKAPTGASLNITFTSAWPSLSNWSAKLSESYDYGPPRSIFVGFAQVPNLTSLSTKVESPFNDVQLSGLLGVGSFGKVYKGLWQGKDIAVKVLLDGKGDIPKEAVLGAKFEHPNVLHTFDCRTSGTEIWILLELCKCSLLKCIDEGAFKSSGDIDLESVITAAEQVAMGMGHLHRVGVVHGDLSSNNVLVSSDNVAKVADFGLSRLAGISTVATESYGTVTHMPPELLSSGLISKKTDVYSFGVVCYELLTSGRAYAGMRSSQVFAAKLYPQGKDHLQLPSYLPDQLVDLVKRCLLQDYRLRPEFDEVVRELHNIRQAI